MSVPANREQFLFGLVLGEVLLPRGGIPSVLPEREVQPGGGRSRTAVGRGAGPRVIRGPENHPGAHRIQLGVPQRGPEMRLIQGAGVVSALPGCPLGLAPRRDGER